MRRLRTAAGQAATPTVVIAALALVIAALLAAIETIGEGRPLLAAAAALAALGFLVLLWKTHSAAVATAALRRDLRRARSSRPRAAPARPTPARSVTTKRASQAPPSRPTASAQRPVASAPVARSSTALSSTAPSSGTVVAAASGKALATPAVTEPSADPTAPKGSTAGRAAAIRPDDESRAERLCSLLGSQPDDHRAPTVGVIGSARLRSALGDLTQIELFPSTAAHVVATASPRFVVLEESFLECGPWAGALETSGTPLFRELQALVQQCAEAGTATLLLPGSRLTPYAAILRRSVSWKVTAQVDVGLMGEDVVTPVLTSLTEYADLEGLGR